MREPAGLETPVMQRRGRAGACSRRLLLAILPAAALVLLLQTVGQAAAISAAGSASPHRLKVEIEARTVAVTRAERTALGVKPSIVSTQLRCGPGEVALAAGAAVDTPGVSLLSSLPTGPRTYRLEIGNRNPASATARLSALCARVTGAPQLPVGTGTGAVTVPAAKVGDDGLVPGRTTVTASCTGASVPVSTGVDLGNDGALTLTQSFPSGRRNLVLVVLNTALAPQPAFATVRCVELPHGFGLTRLTVPVTVPAATGAGASLQPRERQGAAKCPAGKALVGGGYRAPEGGFGNAFPTLRGSPALGYLFRNVLPQPETASVAIFCAPKVVR